MAQVLDNHGLALWSTFSLNLQTMTAQPRKGDVMIVGDEEFGGLDAVENPLKDVGFGAFTAGKPLPTAEHGYEVGSQVSVTANRSKTTSKRKSTLAHMAKYSTPKQDWVTTKAKISALL